MQDMRLIFRKQTILKTVLAVWLALWVFFLAREDKDGQYEALAYNYAHGYAEKVGFLLGKDLYDVLVTAVNDMPGGAAYRLSGFEKFSIDEVRLRYYLWPMRSSGGEADFIIFNGESERPPAGYAEYRRLGSKGGIYKRKDGGS